MPLADTLQFVRQVPAFLLLNDEDLAFLSDQLEVLHFSLGQTVCRAGDPADSFYLVYSGRARVVSASEGKETTVGTLSRGDHFGEQGLISGGTRVYTVRAADDLVLLRLSQEAFERVLQRQPELQGYFRKYVADLSTRNFLRLCSGFRALKPAEIMALLDRLERREFAAGEVVVRQGDPGDRFYLVRSGRARVERDGRTVASLAEGQFFGELALLNRAPRAATVTAETELSTLTLSAEQFTLLLREYPKLRESIESIAYSYGPAPSLDHAAEERREERPEPKVETLAATAASDAGQPVPPSRWGGRRWPVVLQIGEMDCGAACLAMIGKYYGRQYRVPTLRELSEVDRDGASLRGLAEAAEKLGFRARPVKAEFNHIARATMPLIAHWGGNHWVVIYQIDPRGVLMADPACGLRRFTEAEFKQNWTGIALLLEPAGSLAMSEKSPGLLQRFMPLVTPHWKLLLDVLACSVILEVLSLAVPLFTQAILDRVIVHRDVPMLNLMLGGMVVVVLFQLLTSALRQFLLVHTVRRIDVSIAVQFLAHVLRLPMRYFEQTRVGDIVSRFEETRRVRELLTGTALTALLHVVTIFVYLAVMLTYSPLLTLVMVVALPLFAGLTLFVTPLLRANFRNTFEAYCAVQSHLVEAITGAQVVKSVCAERPVRWKWEDLMLKTIRLQFQAMDLRLLLESLSTMMQVSVTVLLLWFGARLVMDGQLTVGQLIALFALSGVLMGAVKGIVNVWDEIQGVRLSLERLGDVLDTAPEVAEQSLPVMPAVKGHIRFEKVTFRYTEGASKNALENIDLELLPGQTVALVGRSGCGKSTLIKLLMRLYDPSSGRITVDGQDVTKVDMHSWRAQVGLVAQDNFLFSGTIRENIALGYPDATLEQVRQAARLAGADEFVSEMPLGYNTMVGERGASLSGGQRQRINIARALLSNPRILVMDEATSALDTESERAIQRNLDTVLRDRTTLVIAHRLSTVRNADRIVVMDRGVIVEQGNHEELMRNRGLYFYLCSQQLEQ